MYRRSLVNKEKQNIQMSVVIFVYHKLVARDSSEVSKGWKCEYHMCVPLIQLL